MYEGFQKFSEEFQKAGKDGFEATVRSFGEVNKGLQAIAAKFADYSKKSFEDGTRAFEQLIGAKSVEQAIEIQSQFKPRTLMILILPRCRNSVRCMSPWLVMRTSRLSKPLPRNARRVVFALQFPTGPGAGPRVFLCERCFNQAPTADTATLRRIKAAREL